ncbi:MAG: cupin domain-containing protein [Psychroserpens sp.]|uniref:cupin domain-containing protein n=1 Tax=Psychroserpens sp. TaxID=2020870 RepID=UPI0030034671
MNLKEKFKDINTYFSPKVIGEVNDVYVKAVSIKGDKVPWHTHEKEDELFYIVEGSLLFEIENEESFTMNPGDLFIVKKGISHRVSSQKECKIMLIEQKTTAHTGTVDTEITKSIQQQLY